MIKVGINGFGRIGRLALRIIKAKYSREILPVAINTSGKMDAAGWAQLFEYDSVYRRWDGSVQATKDAILVDGTEIGLTAELDPAQIPWGEYSTQVVIESTGVFRKYDDAVKHLRDTVKKVIISAPPKDDKIPMLVLGVNEEILENQPIVSCASCTTNCVAPVVKVIEENFGIAKSIMATIHAYTSDQNLHDNSHKDLRRARAAGQNIIPTSTGAAEAVASIFPSLSGKFAGIAYRVPVATGSLTDFIFLTKKPVTKETVNSAFLMAAENSLSGILTATDKPMVSSDIIGSSFSSTIDLSLTQVVDSDLVRVVAWYDNEMGYAYRLVEEAIMLGKRL